MENDPLTLNGNPMDHDEVTVGCCLHRTFLQLGHGVLMMRTASRQFVLFNVVHEHMEDQLMDEPAWFVWIHGIHVLQKSGVETQPINLGSKNRVPIQPIPTHSLIQSAGNS